MEYLNLHSSVWCSAEFVGADPVDRSTWLCLQFYCIVQENSGIIANCAAWKDRRWQQLVRITLKEVRRVSGLWEWQGNDLVVFFYPVDSEKVVIKKREVARVNGKAGGRPTKNPRETNIGFPSDTVSKPTAKAEGKVKEGNGREGNENRDLFMDPVGIVNAYPRRQDVAQALVHLRASIGRGSDPQMILMGTRAIAAVIGELPSGAMNAYVPSAATFFKNERWKDDPATWRRHGAAKNGAAKGTLDLGGRRAGEVVRVNS